MLPSVCGHRFEPVLAVEGLANGDVEEGLGRDAEQRVELLHGRYSCHTLDKGCSVAFGQRTSNRIGVFDGHALVGDEYRRWVLVLWR